MRKLISAAVVAIAATGVWAQISEGAKFMRFNHVNGDVISQINFPSAAYCRASYEMMMREAGDAFVKSGAKLGCTTVDGSALLPYRTLFRDKFLNSSIGIVSSSSQACAEWTKIYLAVNMPGTTELRYMVEEPCEFKK